MEILETQKSGIQWLWLEHDAFVGVGQDYGRIEVSVFFYWLGFCSSSERCTHGNNADADGTLLKI